MTCPELDLALCDYLDGALPRAQRTLLEAHMTECPACAAMARDAAAAVEFMSRTADIEPPQALVTKILYQVPMGKQRTDEGVRGWLNRLMAPVLQPRYVMGAMMTILSLTMMTRCAGAPDHALTAADLDPVKLWAALDDRVHRTWNRSVKAYESMRVVYEVRMRVNEWKQQQQDEETAAAESATDSRKLPAKAPAVQPAQNTR